MVVVFLAAPATLALTAAILFRTWFVHQDLGEEAMRLCWLVVA